MFDLLSYTMVMGAYFFGVWGGYRLGKETKKKGIQ